MGFESLYDVLGERARSELLWSFLVLGEGSVGRVLATQAQGPEFGVIAPTEKVRCAPVTSVMEKQNGRLELADQPVRLS